MAHTSTMLYCWLLTNTTSFAPLQTTTASDLVPFPCNYILYVHKRRFHTLYTHAVKTLAVGSRHHTSWMIFVTLPHGQLADSAGMARSRVVYATTIGVAQPRQCTKAGAVLLHQPTSGCSTATRHTIASLISITCNLPIVSLTLNPAFLTAKKSGHLGPQTSSAQLAQTLQTVCFQCYLKA